MPVTERDVEHIFERLRNGVVPERGLDAFAVGIERKRAELHRQFRMAADGEGLFKFLRGGYGCGKTFMARLALLDAQEQGFATSFVVVSDNDLQFHRFDDVYRKVVQELGTSVCPRGALSDIIDRWIARVENALVSGGADMEAPDFDEAVQRRLQEDLVSLTGGKAPEDMNRVLRTVFRLKQEGQVADAGALLSWLAGSENVAAGVKKQAGIKGDIGSRDALDYLHGILEIVKAAGYRGLVVVIDEAETILRMRRDVRGRSLNGIRQICDAADRFHGMVWIFTGTPEFFDTKRGVAGLEPLHNRIHFMTQGGLASPKQAQLALEPFNPERLREVALKLREMYATDERDRLARTVSSSYVDALVRRVSAGFGGDVGVVPRQFLRRFVNVLDLVAEHPQYDPSVEEGAASDGRGPAAPELNETERRLAEGRKAYDPEPEDETAYSEEHLVEF